MDPLTWAYIVLLLVSSYFSYKNRPKVEELTPVAFQDIDFPQFEEGTKQAVFFGDCWTKDWMILTVGNYRTSPIRKKVG